MNIMHRYRQEIIFVVLCGLLTFIQPRLGLCYLSFELLFIATLGVALFCRWQKNKTRALRAYLLNRMIGFLQPFCTLLFGLFLHLSLTREIATDSLLLLDMALVFYSLTLFNDYFVSLKTRVAVESDLEALVAIEEATFTPEQRASREQILTRLQTHPETCLVATHLNGRVVGSLYLRPMNSACLGEGDFSHRWIQNHDDFSAHHDDDALYIVGLQALPVRGVHVAKYLLAAATQLAISRGYQAIYGGPRLPEYHQHTDLTLEEFMHSSYAHFLNSLKSIMHIPGIMHLDVLRALKNYFPDKASLNAAALVRVNTPFIHLPKRIKSWIADVVYLATVY